MSFNPFEYYSAGRPGWIDDPESRAALVEDKIVRYGAPELKDGSGKRALLWQFRERFDRGAYAKESQTTGDCVSHGLRSCIDTNRCIEILWFKEPEEYYARTATEPLYGARGHGGEGADPGRLTRFASEYGFLARQNYPGVVDLSKYDASIGTRWGRSGVPSDVKELAKKHPAGQFLQPKTPDEARDLLFNGYSVHSGQSCGFAKRADARGISPRQGRWGHDMCTVGYDETREFYPVDVVFIVNSWGQWNYPPDKWSTELYGPWIPGMIVADKSLWDDIFVGSESMYSHSGITGYEAREITSLGLDWL